jgi:hypothetical protein
MKIFLSILATLITTCTYGQTTSLNVTNFGAIGDATNLLVSCTSNSDIVKFPVAIPQSYSNEVILLFNAGWAQSGTLSSGATGMGWQDQVATITNISGTSVYMNRPASNTLTGTYCVIGHNNVASFLACNAKCGPGTNMYIPGLPNSITGVYLSVPTNSSGPYGDYCLLITNCGYTIYGDGSNILSANGPDLMCSGAWQFKEFGGVGITAARGEYFVEWPPIGNNNLPLTIQNLTVDGGVQQGNTPYHGEYINQVDGGGWDTSHDAWLVWDSASLGNINNLIFTNVTVQHWRGEQLKSIDTPSAGGFTCINSTFYDGGATAINFYPSSTYTNCVFNNMWQWFEIYQQHTTGPDRFVNCLVTNIAYNLAAVNGGVPFCPPLTISGCTIWPWDQQTAGGYNGIQFLPADNVTIESNYVTCPDAYGQSSFTISTVTGWQGTGPSSNILIYANSVTNCSELHQAGGGSGAESVVDVMVDSNYIASASAYNGQCYLMYDYGTTTNYFIRGNNCSPLLSQTVYTVSGVGGSPFALVGTNNIYWTYVTTTANAANALDYVNGSRFYISGPFTGSTTKYALTTTDASQIPPGAVLLVANGNSSSASIPIYLNTALTSGPITVPAGQVLAAMWTNNAWVQVPTGSGANVGAAIMQVTPGSVNFGTFISGKTKTNNFTIENVGGNTLSGTASVPAPFSILSGGNYSLGADQSQTVSVVFSPASSGTYSQYVVFVAAGFAGTNVTVSGTATNVVSGVAPTVSAITASVANQESNPSFYAVNPGTVQLSATAASSKSDALSWQWWYNVNGGAQTVYQIGSGTAPTITLTNSVNAGGNTNVWTLQVTDTKNGLSVQAQIPIYVMVPPPQEIQIVPN